MIRAFAALLALAALGAGCGGAKSTRRLRPDAQAPAEAWQPVRTIAVLPPSSWTDHGLEYVAWYRAVIGTLLRERGYATVPIAHVNRFLIRNRFTTAGELGMYSNEELCREFAADAVFHWQITGDAPTLEIALVRADNTVLWASGEVQLGLKFRAYPSDDFRGADATYAMALAEILRRLPARS
jgi:hypothetical protein